MIFYEIKISYTRQTGEDNPAAVKEAYMVEGLTCTDVESRLIEEIKPFMSGEWEVKSCKQVQFYDLLPNPEGDRWYKARVEMITVEDNGKETRKAVSIYVQAGNLTEANKTLHQALNNLDCEVISITRSPILEVFRAI
ncbi:MAG: DUF4494 domain-containing protein [Paludibacteraceae bacterium]|jgi:hypothetical protein|nr:DUF4494 domain-containing protein [Paludibacteraceae bacterium]